MFELVPPEFMLLRLAALLAICWWARWHLRASRWPTWHGWLWLTFLAATLLFLWRK